MPQASCFILVGGGVDVRAILLGLAFVAMWSSAFTAARTAVLDAPPFAILTLRFFIAGMIAVIWARAIGQRLPQGRSQWIAVILFGICQNALYLGLNFFAMQTIPASMAVIIASSLPLLVALFALLWGGERLSVLTGFGLVAGFAGVLIVMLGRLGGSVDLRGVAFSVLGVLALTGATLLLQRTQPKSNILMVVGLQMLVGSVTLLPVSLLTEEIVVNPTLSLLVAFLYMMFVPGLLATFVWFRLVGMIGPTKAATFHFLNPFFGVLIAAMVLGEPLGATDLLGVAIIMAGILAVQLARTSRR